MFVGHYAVSLATRRTSVVLPLWVWFLAVQWLDIVFDVLVLAGVEKLRIVEGFTESNDLDLYYMPFSHGLPGAVLLSLGLAGIVAVAFPAARRPLAFGLVALASFSHWLIDLPMHTPDMPLYGNTAKVGFGLWDHPEVGVPLELAVLVLGGWLYVRSATPTDRGKLFVWAFVALLAVLQVVAHFGPTPTSQTGFAVTALGLYVVLIALAAWVERRAVAPRAE
ncbi:MAG: hypothetical protein ACRDIL_05310 [Candidatus Limnocylindrales bacterium]